MNRTSQWAGYCASFFSITFFVMGTAFVDSKPGWMHVLTGWCMMLAAFSGVVCLVSAIFSFLRNRR